MKTSRPKSTPCSTLSLDPTLRIPSLEDLLTIRPTGLDEVETWAVLCQSVQALQDLFLSDGASGKHSLPLITPTTLKLSAKGRVKLQPTDALVGFGVSSNLAIYLAPEYRVNRSYSDTEHEKMWIYSLGQTLKRAAVTCHGIPSRLSDDICQVLSNMTHLQYSLRASLMNLLDVMSDYCKKCQQNRPFSHIIMDLHQEALAGIEASADVLWGPPAMPELIPRTKTMSESTDKFNSLHRRLAARHKITKEVSTSMADLSFTSFSNIPGSVVRPKSLCVPQENIQTIWNNNYNSPFKGTLNEVKRKNRLKVRKNPIQRMASRLYRVESTSELSKDNSFVGPEFVIKATLPPKLLSLASSKSTKKSVIVILLDGQRLEISCNLSNTTAGQLLQLIIEEEHIEENFMLGLSALIAGDFVFMPTDTKISKVLQCNNDVLTFYLRVRFFLPSLRGIRGPQAKHLLYLQLRRSVLEHQLPSSFSQIVELTGLALQAEFGNHEDLTCGSRDYFLLEHYVPETMVTIIDDENNLKQELIKAHTSKKGLDKEKAEEDFIIFAQSLPHYGGHFYTAVWSLKDTNRKDIWLYINTQGINMYERGKAASHFGPRLYEKFEWKDIRTLCYSKHYLSIIPQDHVSQFKKFKIKMEDKKSYFAFRLASLHHQFFVRLRREFMSLNSLGQQFGVPLKDIKNATNSLCKNDDTSKHSRVYKQSIVEEEERQNKENEKPLLSLDNSVSSGIEKRRGVKMGTRAFATPSRPSQSIEAVNEYLDQMSLDSMSLHCSSASLDLGDAYVLDTTLKSISQHNILPNFQESINETFLEKLKNMSFEEERILSTVTVDRDSSGSLGLQVTEGSDGNVYVQSVISGGPAYFQKGIVKGDQVVAVNGQSLLGRKYSDSLELLKNTGSQVEFVLSRLIDPLRRSPSIESHVEKHLTESCCDSSNGDKYLNRSRVKKDQFFCDNDKAVIVEMIPKKGIIDWSSGQDHSVASNVKYLKKKTTPLALPRSLGLGRRWNGPVRYPVTPVKKSAEGSDSEGEQVFI